MKIWSWVGIAAAVIAVGAIGGYVVFDMKRPCNSGQGLKLAGVLEIAGCR